MLDFDAIEFLSGRIRRLSVRYKLGSFRCGESTVCSDIGRGRSPFGRLIKQAAVFDIYPDLDRGNVFFPKLVLKSYQFVRCCCCQWVQLASPLE